MLDSQSNTDNLLQPPLTQLPLFLQPLGNSLPQPPEEHPEQPIV